MNMRVLVISVVVVLTFVGAVDLLATLLAPPSLHQAYGAVFFLALSVVMMVVGRKAKIL